LLPMTEEGREVARSQSLPGAFPWQVSQVGHLCPDQSYLGRPVDPEIVARVRSSLDKYTGPRTTAEHEKIIADKAEKKQKATQQQTAEYLAWAQKVKAETVCTFKLPEDSRKKNASDDYIKSKVKHGLRVMRETNENYKVWVAGMAQKQAFKLHEKLNEKRMADASFNDGAANREHDRALRDAAIRGQVADQQAQYWSWLKTMKSEVDKRPNTAPPAGTTGVESVEAMAKKKRAELQREFKKTGAEYAEWLVSVQKPKFALPPPYSFAEDRERKAVIARQKAEDLKKTTNEYFQNVRKVQEKHHDRIMRKVDQKKRADAMYNDQQASGAEMLAAKLEAEGQRQREIALKSKQELRDMYDRVKAKPMFLEVAYSKSASTR